MKPLKATFIGVLAAAVFLHVAQYAWWATDGCPDIYQGISFDSYGNYLISIKYSLLTPIEPQIAKIRLIF
jgi:hypothetical protein